MREPRTIAIFCQVLDNYGDVGVCWRLARRFAHDGKNVTLWVDDLKRLQRLRPSINPGSAEQALDHFTLRSWSDAAPLGVVADLIISAFGCRLPEADLIRMSAVTPPPVWVNLEYLSAEPWVEGSHLLPSPHPRWPLREYFFFPGFTQRTGGLLCEPDLLARRKAFDVDTRSRFLSRLGIQPPTGSKLVSLFCYPSAPIASLFHMMQSGAPVMCLVPEGVTALAPAAGETWSRGALTLKGVPFLEPDEYDHLLWSCDLNFVRGEDSAVRAQWAAQPMLWQLYPQADDAHAVKLQAFSALYSESLDPHCASTWDSFSRWWNGSQHATPDWRGLLNALPVLKAYSYAWQQRLASIPELASSLIEFARQIR